MYKSKVIENSKKGKVSSMFGGLFGKKNKKKGFSAPAPSYHNNSTPRRVEDNPDNSTSTVEQTVSHVADEASERLSQAKDVVEETFSNLKETASEKLSDIQEVASDVADDVKEFASEKVDEVEEFISDDDSDEEVYDSDEQWAMEELKKLEANCPSIDIDGFVEISPERALRGIRRLVDTSREQDDDEFTGLWCAEALLSLAYQVEGLEVVGDITDDIAMEAVNAIISDYHNRRIRNADEEDAEDTNDSAEEEAEDTTDTDNSADEETVGTPEDEVEASGEADTDEESSDDDEDEELHDGYIIVAVRNEEDASDDVQEEDGDSVPQPTMDVDFDEFNDNDKDSVKSFSVLPPGVTAEAVEGNSDNRDEDEDVSTELDEETDSPEDDAQDNESHDDGLDELIPDNTDDDDSSEEDFEDIFETEESDDNSDNDSDFFNVETENNNDDDRDFFDFLPEDNEDEDHEDLYPDDPSNDYSADLEEEVNDEDSQEDNQEGNESGVIQGDLDISEEDTEDVQVRNKDNLILLRSGDKDKLRNAIRQIVEDGKTYLVDLSNDEYGDDIVPEDSERSYAYVGNVSNGLKFNAYDIPSIIKGQGHDKPSFIIVAGVDDILVKIDDKLSDNISALDLIDETVIRTVDNARAQGVTIIATSSQFSDCVAKMLIRLFKPLLIVT